MSTINIDENDVNVINTNANTNAINKLARNTIHMNATDKSTNIINIDENNVNVINKNANTNATNEIV